MYDDSTDTGPNASTFGQMRDNSLKSAGWAYLIGDVALSTAKFMEGDNPGGRGALLWGVGGIAAARYGNPKAEKQLQLLERKLSAYLQKQGVKIPANPSAATLAKPGGVIDHLEAFLYAHPSEMLNAVYAIGAASTIKGGFNKKATWDITSGALIMAGALAGLLIPEKAPDPNNRAEGIVGKAWECVREKPLRVSGTLYHLNNLAMLAGAYVKWKEKPTAVNAWFRFLTAASYIFGNTMLSLSSRHNTLKDEQKNLAMLETLSDKAATIIAAQKPEVQEALVQNIAGYLAAQPEAHRKAPEIASLLHTRLASIAHTTANSWMARVTHPVAPSLHPSL